MTGRFRVLFLTAAASALATGSFGQTISGGNFPPSQAVTGTVAVAGVATAVNQPALHADGGALAHVANWPASQAVTGAVSVSSLPGSPMQQTGGTIQATNLPASVSTGAGTAGTSSLRTTVAQDASTIAGAPTSTLLTTKQQDSAGSDITDTVNHALRVNVVVGGGGGGGASGVSQGSATSGQMGGLTQGAVTTAAPTYTTGQTNPISMDLTGAIRMRVEAGEDVALGSPADVAWSSGAGSLVAIDKAGVGFLATIAGNSGTAIPVQSAVGKDIGGVDQIGTWTMQPGNTANTTPWLFSLSGSLPAGGNTIGSVTNPRQATASVAVNISTSGTTQLVPLAAGQAIYVSSYDFVVGGTDTVTLEYGTGALCAVGTTALTGPYAFIANDGIAKGNGGAPLLFVPAGNALCVVNGSATQLSGSVSYAQF